MEVKPLGAPKQLVTEDEVKLMNMMKGALDSLLEAGYDVTVAGVFVQGCEARVLGMSLEHEATYIVKEHRRFRSPSKPNELPLAITMLPVLERL
ncbi:hypothetical protein BGZ54_007575 [Gamsiella multidivaricata]|nr:hypothetical protein BGZ54_007575 [Gamsiella multidivaricata]